ncbi:MAG: hypothetical protein PHQ23_02980 [Candidatus Wallbacteria bacterium]|nr:hypothetical protein [Candidatus Wallbacteria bacterium]
MKIEPMIDSMEPGSSEVFTTSIVYPDDTPALVPAGAILQWTWEVSGNEGDGHDFISTTGNTATYIAGSGDFMDTIITAKCKIDAGIFTGKRSGKAVDRFVWVEGDNHVPLCFALYPSQITLQSDR